MSVQSQVQAAEEALRQALINALAEGDDQYLTELFNEYQHVSDLNKKISNTQFVLLITVVVTLLAAVNSISI